MGASALGSFLGVSSGSLSAVDPGVLEIHVLELASREVHALPLQVAGLDPVAAAVEHVEARPGVAVEVEIGPGASAEARVAEPGCVELRMAECAVDERAAGNGDAFEVTCAESAVGELARSPACLLEGGAREAARGESAGCELRQVQVEACVGEAVGLANQASGGAAGAFAPEVVVEDDYLRTHFSARSFSELIAEVFVTANFLPE